MSKFKINNKILSKKGPLYFIADIAANHDGDLNRALKLIELAKEAGADAAKFQNFQASQIVSKAGFNALETKLSHQKKWEKSIYETYEEASISQNWTKTLKDKCDEVGIDYFTSAYDFESVDLVNPYVDVYKIGSGDITWLDILTYIAKKNKPIILATGASTLEDIQRAVTEINKHNSNIAILQCNTNYTNNIENFKYINLNVLDTLKIKFKNILIGLSDHTQGHSTILGAIAKGGTIFEKHFTDDNTRKGPDHNFSMNPTTWKEMIKRSQEVFQALGDGIKRIEENEKQSIIVQQRSLRFNKPLNKNHIITKNDLIAVRPLEENCIKPYMIHTVVGKQLTQNVKTDELVKLSKLK